MQIRRQLLVRPHVAAGRCCTSAHGGQCHAEPDPACCRAPPRCRACHARQQGVRPRECGEARLEAPRRSEEEAVIEPDVHPAVQVSADPAVVPPPAQPDVVDPRDFVVPDAPAPPDDDDDAVLSAAAAKSLSLVDKRIADAQQRGDASVMCQAKTLKGEYCTWKAMPGLRFCGTHAKKKRKNGATDKDLARIQCTQRPASRSTSSTPARVGLPCRRASAL